VLVHAFGSGSRAWAPQVHGLSDHDLVRGRSARPRRRRRPFTLPRAVESVRATIDEAGGTAHVVGISGGAVVGLLTCLEHPAQVSSLVLSGGLARAPRWFAPQRAIARITPEPLLARMLEGSYSGKRPEHKHAAGEDFDAAANAPTSPDSPSSAGSISVPGSAGSQCRRSFSAGPTAAPTSLCPRSSPPGRRRPSGGSFPAPPTCGTSRSRVARVRRERCRHSVHPDVAVLEAVEDRWQPLERDPQVAPTAIAGCYATADRVAQRLDGEIETLPGYGERAVRAATANASKASGMSEPPVARAWPRP
jgi:pimeloyl-ACP methyl ester carboxylesterase